MGRNCCGLSLIHCLSDVLAGSEQLVSLNKSGTLGSRVGADSPCETVSSHTATAAETPFRLLKVRRLRHPDGPRDRLPGAFMVLADSSVQRVRSSAQGVVEDCGRPPIASGGFPPRITFAYSFRIHITLPRRRICSQ
jgi:hypothetical protein